MTERSLRGCRILVVEDDYPIAEGLRTDLEDAKATPIGPVGTVEAALELVRRESAIDGAVLDVNLHGVSVFPVADLLLERGVPFLFATGYDPSMIPARFAGVVLCEKPIDIARVGQAIGREAAT
jgi:CheY-like chemotaxis protein